MNIKSKLIETIKTLGFVEGSTLILQGTLGEDSPYPPELVTFWVQDTSDGSHYDDQATNYDWTISVIYYSDDPQKVLTVPDTIRKALKAAGFIPQGKGQDVPSDEPSHTGWQMSFVVTDYEE